MKVTISVEVNSEKEAETIIARIYRKYKTWDETLEEQGILPKEEPPPAPAERANVSPGEPAISKIGTDSRVIILEAVKRNMQPGAKFTEHAKLLWKRGELKFDGEKYYV